MTSEEIISRSALATCLRQAAFARLETSVDRCAVSRFGLDAAPVSSWQRLSYRTNATDALALPEVRDQLREQGAEVVGKSPAELATYVAADIPKWAALARQAGVKPL